MRRSKLVKLALSAVVASVPALSSLARADDAPAPPPASSSAATTTASAPASAAPTTPVVVPLTTPAASAGAEGHAWAVTEDDPLRLLQLMRGEADRQKLARYGNAVTSIVVGAGVVTTGALFLGATDDTYYRIFGWVMVGTGVLTGLGSLFSFFGSSSLERLADAYQPIAEDTSLPATVRRARGEEGLRAVAAQEKGWRTVNGVSSIIFGVAIGALGVGLALALDVSESFRIPLAVAAGFGGIGTVAQGVGQIVWTRGPAEVAIEHWDAARGAPNVGRLRLSPTFAPLPGGGYAGLALSY
jgi:hypothetical protein